MIDLAIKYESKLQELFANTAMDEKYMYYYGGSYSEKYKASNSTWSYHEFVSLDLMGNIIGFISYSINRDSYSVDSLQIINFSDDKITFGVDIKKVLYDIFNKFQFRKLSYGVYVGNPIEKAYDKLTLKYGGRIVGTQLKHSRLLDGNYYDYKMYEILKEDFDKLKIEVKL